MTKLQIKPVSFDKNDETLYITKRLTLGDKTFFTPIVSLELRQITQNEQLASATKGLNEIYRQVGTEKTPLRKIIFDRKIQDKFTYRLRTDYKKGDKKEFTFCIFECADTKYPLGRELEFIIDMAYSYSDIVPLPTLPNITTEIRSESDFAKFQVFLEEIIHILQDNKNEKPILGLIPRLAYGFMADLVEFYISKGINTFYVDLEARNPVTFRDDLIPIYRTLKRHEMIENSFIYAHNVDAGRIGKKSDVVNAKDILSFGFGFDAMGRRHKRRLFPEKVRKKIDTSSNKLRLFNKEDYGYHRISNPSKIREMYPMDSSIPITALSRGISGNMYQLKKCERLFNNEQLGLEAFRVRQIVKDYIPTKYLAAKRFVKKTDIKLIKRFKNKVDEKRLKQESFLDYDVIS